MSGAGETRSVGEYVEAWVCDQPARDVIYQVIRERWVEDDTVRLIEEIRIVGTADRPPVHIEGNRQ